MTDITASRYHDISCGHRVYGHESKCAHLHGHNYRIHFTVKGINTTVDGIGRVIDFGVIKSELCQWLEENWDHKFLLWEQDPSAAALQDIDFDGVVLVPFNPTAENMAKHLLLVICPAKLTQHGVFATEVIIEETAKCQARAKLS